MTPLWKRSVVAQIAFWYFMIQTAASLLSPAIDWPAGDIRHADAVAFPSFPVPGREGARAVASMCLGRY